jgi:fatty acid desaturase
MKKTMRQTRRKRKKRIPVRYIRTLGLLFAIAGILWMASSWIGSNEGIQLPIGMINVCTGMMFLGIAEFADDARFRSAKKGG